MACHQIPTSTLTDFADSVQDDAGPWHVQSIGFLRHDFPGVVGKTRTWVLVTAAVVDARPIVPTTLIARNAGSVAVESQEIRHPPLIVRGGWKILAKNSEYHTAQASARGHWRSAAKAPALTLGLWCGLRVKKVAGKRHFGDAANSTMQRRLVWLRHKPECLDAVRSHKHDPARNGWCVVFAAHIKLLRRALPQDLERERVQRVQDWTRR
jgi:hypothetical protein